MSQYRPDLQEILRTVRELTVELMPHVDAKAKYDLRVAAYLLEMAERELTEGPALERKQRAQLEKLLGHEANDALLADLEAELATRLRKGELDDRFDDVLAMVLEQTADSVRIVKPSHLDPLHGGGR
jgi:hypothetical protein